MLLRTGRERRAIAIVSAVGPPQSTTLVLMKRVLLAFLIAPATALLLAGMADGIGFIFAGRLDLLGPAIALTTIYSYPTAVILGIPAFYLFRRSGWIEWWHFVLGGAAIGCIPPLIVLLAVIRVPLPEFFRDADLFMLCGLGASLGAVSALVLWAIASPFNMKHEH